MTIDDGSDAIDAAARSLRRAGSVVVFTGAGVSAESGIPTFRSGENALWANSDIEQFANPRGYRRRAPDAWQWYARRAQIAREARPNLAHEAIRDIELHVPEFLLITQNIDGLHHRAGNTKVLELHGTLRRARCFDCRNYIEWPDPPGAPVCMNCGGMLRPDVVMFEEELPPGAMDTALAVARSCDVLLSVGTSNVVWPAAEIPHAAMRAGATVIVINPDLEGQPWGRNTIAVAASAGAALPSIIAKAWRADEATG
ncbi:MAG TPA: NAD-dependent deacylase [Gemmatimonadaceae bacterium]|jgi:NAD-dependent deacetylase|nr:NAD-dependent deacylase [Gemmatimonadaceae bacterium]